MKKVASILAVVLFALGMFSTQIENTLDANFDLESMLACGNCADEGDRGRDGGFKWA